MKAKNPAGRNAPTNKTVRRLKEQEDKLDEQHFNEPTYEELKTRVAALESSSPDLTFRVSNKGGVSVYGLGRFPVTLYFEQWVRLLDSAADLRKFVMDNKSHCKLKGQ